MGAVPALGGLMQMGPAPVARGGLTPTASPAARELLQVYQTAIRSAFSLIVGCYNVLGTVDTLAHTEQPSDKCDPFALAACLRWA